VTADPPRADSAAATHRCRSAAALPAKEGKALLSDVLLAAGAPRLLYVQHVEGDEPAFFASGCGTDPEGVVSKRRGSRYRLGPRKDWLKAKRHEIGSFVITAFEEIVPGELEAIHVAEETAGGLRVCDQIRVSFPSRTLCACARSASCRGPSGKAVSVNPKLRVSAKLFGRHRSGIIRDGVGAERHGGRLAPWSRGKRSPASTRIFGSPPKCRDAAVSPKKDVGDGERSITRFRGF
jgi:hypothetical protein